MLLLTSRYLIDFRYLYLFWNRIKYIKRVKCGNKFTKFLIFLKIFLSLLSVLRSGSGRKNELAPIHSVSDHLHLFNADPDPGPYFSLLGSGGRNSKKNK